ncbi:taste receptor type 2 member 40-like [Lissotriton helveticus]
MLTVEKNYVLMGIILLLEYLSGILINIFITVVISMDWVKRQHVIPCDIIVLVIAFSRTLVLSGNMVYVVLINVYYGQCFAVWVDIVFLYFGTFLSISSFWFTALLYVYYCVTIANFRQMLFVRLKVKIPQLMPWLILACTAVSLLYALPSPWFQNVSINNSATIFFANNSGKDSTMETVHWKPVLYYLLGYVPPFLIFCVAAVLLIASLFRHTRRMQGCTDASSCPRMDAHYRAVKCVVAFFLLFAAYGVACLFETMGPFLTQETWDFVTPAITQWYPFVHSTLLIRSYPKLNKAAGRALRHAQCWKQRAAPEEQMLSHR